ncbi:hypothetical protein JZO79_04435 [Vagococcus fluvialis]|uniref:MAG6450 family protein n=1 Tax=Vagococcus fluvialis TaxID=2738 RepID=UPI001A8FEF3B|nr:hypothetical protein [Vagococcus fluvialis]MBO0442846.1 hypothetical protein [Vagococcus fluvialis]
MKPGNLTKTNSESKGTSLNKPEVLFRICIQEPLHREYCFNYLDRSSLKLWEKFIDETVGKKLTITQVEQLFLRTQAHGPKYEKIEIEGNTREVIHLGKDRTKFRIYGYYNEQGYFVVHRIDPKHKSYDGKNKTKRKK